MKIQLIDANEERLRAIKESLRGLPQVGYVKVDKAVYVSPPPGLDMIFMTLPAAEEWNPDVTSRTAQILETSSRNREKGFPPLIVTGVNLAPEDPKDSLSQVRIVLESVLEATRSFNQRYPARIKTLGFWMMDLTRGVTVTQLSELLHKLLQNEPFDSSAA